MTAEFSAIRDLAAELGKSQVSFDPATYLNGIVTAVNATTPPTVDLLMSGDSTVTIPAVRYLDSLTPAVSDLVIVAKQGSAIWVVGKIAASAAAGTAWITPALGTGFTGDGNDNGTVQYRLVVDGGSSKMQWRGGAAISGSQTALVASALAAQYRPGDKRSVVIARDIGGGSTNAAQIDFNTDGTCSLILNSVAGNSASPGTDNVDPVDSTTNDSGHSHGVTGGHSHTVNSHTHSVTHPTWISLNGIEYFL